MITDLIYVNGRSSKTELVMSLLPPILMGILSFFLVVNFAVNYFDVAKAIIPLPPAVIFAVVWFAVLLLMGAGSYRAKLAAPHSAAHMSYAASLLSAFMWNIVLLRFNEAKAAFLIIILYLFFLTATFFEFDKADTSAGRLMLPAVVWALLMALFNLAGLKAYF